MQKSLLSKTKKRPLNEIVKKRRDGNGDRDAAKKRHDAAMLEEFGKIVRGDF